MKERMLKMMKSIVMILVLVGSFFSANVFGQTYQKSDQNVCVDLATERLVVGIDNPLIIVYPQVQPIRAEDIRAQFQSELTSRSRELEILDKYGHLFLRVDSVGYVTLTIKTKDGEKVKRLQTTTIEPVARLSRFGANHEGTIGAGEFRAQMGLRANIESYDICGSCQITEFEMIRIDHRGKWQKTINKQGRFKNTSSALVKLATAGDIYIFRNIRYKCPGHTENQRLEDMIFEIK